MTDHPFFSIGIPVFNGAKTIKNCLNTILSQSFRDFVVLVVDDGSQDKTWEILCEMSLHEPRLCAFRNSINLGIGKTREIIAERAVSSYLLWVDSDDFLEPESLRRIHDYCVALSPTKKSVIIQNAYIQRKSGRKPLFRTAKKPIRLDPDEALRRVVLNDGLGSYPWLFLVPTERAKAIRYPPRQVSFVDDQYASYRYLLGADDVYFLRNLLGYCHTIDGPSDSHCRGFYGRLANTYRLLLKEEDPSFLRLKLLSKLQAYAEVYSAFDVCENETHPKAKKVLASISITLRGLKREDPKLLRAVSFKMKLWITCLRFWPNLFLTVYGGRGK